MIPGNGVPAATDRDEGVPRATLPLARQTRDDSQLRDIQDLIARLEVVNRQLAFPVREMPAPRQANPGDAGTPAAADEATAR